MISAFESTSARAARPRRLLRSGIVATLTLLLGASRAYAEDAETRTAARDLATQGGQAFDAGHYELASDFFLRAYELVHAPSIGLMRARSLSKLGRLLEAVDLYEQTARFKLSPDAPEAYVKAVDTARSEVEDVRRRVPRLKILVLNAGAGDNAEVSIDDKPTPHALLGVDRPMNPGLHRVVMSLAGQVRATRELILDEGKSYSVQLDVGGSAPARAVDRSVSPSALREPLPPAVSSRGSTTRVLGYVGIGVGVLGLGVGTYTGLVALHYKSRLDDVCHPACPESSSGDLSGFRSNRTASWLSYGVGIASAASGVLLLTLGDSQRERLALRVVPGGLQIGGQL